MATMTYEQYLAALGRRGLPAVRNATTSAAYLNWRAQQPENQVAAVPVAAPVAQPNVSTALTPEDFADAIMKDPAALGELSSAQQQFTSGGAGAFANWQAAKNALAAQVPQLALQQEQGLRNAASRTAARGTAQSGQGELEKQQARADYTNQLAGVERQSQEADTRYQTEGTQLAADYNTAATGARTGAATRLQENRLQDFPNTYGIPSGVGGNVPTATNAAPPAPPTLAAPRPGPVTLATLKKARATGNPVAARRLFNRRYA